MDQNMTLDEYITSHCFNSFEKALLAERYPTWKHSCPEISDVNFIRLGMFRCMGAGNSGLHFLQSTNTVHNELYASSTYFNALSSGRRTKMLKAVEKESLKIYSEQLALYGIDYLQQFPELAEYTVEAADGHFIDHACHTPKSDNGKVYAAGFIYALNLRNGLLRPLCCVTAGTKRTHEIPALQRYIERDNVGNKGRSMLTRNLYIYDKAVTKYSWWDVQKGKNNYMISVLKENSVSTKLSSIAFEKNEINIGVESYSVYQTTGGVKFNLIKYRDPETKVLHSFITTLPQNINPGTIAMLYFKRWSIEKTFNNSKSDFKERKAWSPHLNSLDNQMRLTAMTYNLMRVFEEASKAEEPEKVHRSDLKYTKSLKKRDVAASKIGCFVNPLFFYARVTRISSFTIRMIQDSVLIGKSLGWLINSLATNLIIPPLKLVGY